LSITDRLLANAARYAATFDKGDLPLAPALHVAILTCMDARLNPYALLGLAEGDAHIIRNAGGVVTPDGLRSLAISQRLLGTREVIVIHHTDCGSRTITDDEFRAQILADTGFEPPWAAGSFEGLDGDVRQSIARIREEPSIPFTGSVRGFVYDVTAGSLTEIV